MVFLLEKSVFLTKIASFLFFKYKIKSKNFFYTSNNIYKAFAQNSLI